MIPLHGISYFVSQIMVSGSFKTFLCPHFDDLLKWFPAVSRGVYFKGPSNILSALRLNHMFRKCNNTFVVFAMNTV